LFLNTAPWLNQKQIAFFGHTSVFGLLPEFTLNFWNTTVPPPFFLVKPTYYCCLIVPDTRSCLMGYTVPQNTWRIFCCTLFAPSNTAYPTWSDILPLQIYKIVAIEISNFEYSTHTRFREMSPKNVQPIPSEVKFSEARSQCLKPKFVCLSPLKRGKRDLRALKIALEHFTRGVIDYTKWAIHLMKKTLGLVIYIWIHMYMYVHIICIYTYVHTSTRGYTHTFV